MAVSLYVPLSDLVGLEHGPKSEEQVTEIEAAARRSLSPLLLGHSVKCNRDSAHPLLYLVLMSVSRR